MDKQHIPVFFHSSDEFCPYMCVTMVSILYNTEAYIDFYVIETGISNFNKKRIESLCQQFPNFSINWIKFEYNEIFKKEYFENMKKEDLNKKEWPGIHAYCTPFMPLINKNIDKLIYLDSDVIFLDDITKFYNHDINDYYLGVIPDIVCPLYMTVESRAKNKNINYEDFGKYFCAGVLLINAKKFREDDIIKQYFELTQKEDFVVCDQDILNRLFQNGKCKMLEQKYHFIMIPSQEELDKKGILISNDIFKQAKKNIIIRHFAGEKPWKTVSQTINDIEYPILNKNDFWFFARLTPFYEGILTEFISNQKTVVKQKEIVFKKYDVKIFGFLTILTFRKFGKHTKIYLFGKIHFMDLKEKNV